MTRELWYHHKFPDCNVFIMQHIGGEKHIEQPWCPGQNISILSLQLDLTYFYPLCLWQLQLKIYFVQVPFPWTQYLITTLTESLQIRLST